ncbi:hypothetical protein J2S43_000812 [Catenuloplanes nepalensis]|uniref:DUF3159 domain-containing protein n=1 Tax=Catenuloplanes nepalensis TaxID=587533 RepID=A0ABT9MLJ5_9ACTN|nr:DUF3159 domain-containing protein [Catenuloplanes nepalensis]MDP9792300.1 hypothetical protein [Catenuloplanes nepalensis]
MEQNRESLADLLGGRRGAIDATLPPIAFILGWLAGGRSIVIGVTAAIVVSLAIAVHRLRKGDRFGAVLAGLLGVVVAAMIALYTGNGADFFLPRLLSNAGSAVVWAISIAARWPLLGVIVGAVLGQRTRWRRDPALLRSYGLASWIWVLQYVIRLAVFLPLYFADQVFALGVAQVVLTWPLVAACLAVSWWVMVRTLPKDHPGLRHPQSGRTVSKP